MPRKLTFEQACARLRRCKDADAVARMLKRAGVKGIREDPNCCPIANWIRKVDGVAGGEPNVGCNAIAILSSDRGLIAVERDLPAAFEFVSLFDELKYPELETGYRAPRKRRAKAVKHK